MNTIEQIQDLLLALHTVAKENPDLGFHDTIGICTNVSCAIDHVFDGKPSLRKKEARHYFDRWMLDNVFRWEHYSGNIKYPVPYRGGAERYYSSSDAYTWIPKWSGEYGEMRRKLLAWIIAGIELELSINENLDK